MKTIIIIATVLSAVIALIAIVIDPLALPFQDWEQMPKSSQEYYIKKSNEMGVLRNIFSSFFILGITYLFLNIIFGIWKKMKMNRSNATLK